MLYPRFCIVFVNFSTWKFSASEGYKLSNQSGIAEANDHLKIDDAKLFSTSKAI